MNDPFKNAQQQLSDAVKILKLDNDITNRLMWPDRVLKFHIPVKMDDGSLKLFEGFRSQHNNALGPYKGGVRFHPDVNEEEVKALSMWMTWKTATTNIPYGGGKGGVVVDPNNLSLGELERLSRGYVRKIFELIGPNKDIPAPDVNTTPEIMAWFVDEYEKLLGEKAPGVFTGKPIELGGSLGRTQATGQGGVYILEELAKLETLNPNDTTIAIQGIGNVGYWFGKLAQNLGFKIVAISDSKGGIYDGDGIDMDAANEYKSKNGSLNGFGEKVISNKELLELDVDVLIPAALENVITELNANEIKAKYILEMANGPVTPEADAILFNKDIIVVPDILANAGGVTVSYFEWVQNNMGYYWKEEEVLEKLQPLMVNALTDVLATAKDRKINLRMAAYVLAVRRVADALILKGIAS